MLRDGFPEVRRPTLLLGLVEIDCELLLGDGFVRCRTLESRLLIRDGHFCFRLVLKAVFAPGCGFQECISFPVRCLAVVHVNYLSALDLCWWTLAEELACSTCIRPHCERGKYVLWSGAAVQSGEPLASLPD